MTTLSYGELMGLCGGKYCILKSLEYDFASSQKELCFKDKLVPTYLPMKILSSASHIYKK